MDRILLFLLIIYGFIFWGFVGLNGEIFLFAIPFLLYIFSGFFRATGESGLEVKRVLEPERGLPGMHFEIKLSITNISPQPVILGIQDQVHERLKTFSGVSNKITFLRPNQTSQLNYSVTGLRGIFPFDYVKITRYGVDSLLRRDLKISTQGQLYILPHIPHLKRVGIRTWHTKVYSGNIPSRVSGSGVDFFGIRDYLSGDPIRYVNWRISARYPGSLFSNEFERERVTDIWLILDGRQRSNIRTGNNELFEHIVLSGAGLAQALLKEGNRVGLLVYGGYLQWTYPGYGKMQRERIIRALAQARPGDLYVFSDLQNLPTRAFPVSSQLIFVSPLHAEDVSVLLNLRARGYAILVISPDPINFENAQLSHEEGGTSGIKFARIERSLQLQRLRNSGIRVLNWDVSVPFERAVQIPLKDTYRYPLPLRQIR